MFYITSFGLGHKKIVNEDEARSKVKSIDDLYVTMTFPEYLGLKRQHETELYSLQGKLDQSKSKIESIKHDANIFKKTVEEDTTKQLNNMAAELQECKRSLKNYKEALGRWKEKAQGAKGVTQKPLAKGSLAKSITFKINDYPSNYSMRIIIETEIPNNMSLTSTHEYFRNLKAIDVFPEAQNNEYRIIEAYSNGKSDSWSVVLTDVPPKK